MPNEATARLVPHSTCSDRVNRCQPSSHRVTESTEEWVIDGHLHGGAKLDELQQRGQRQLPEEVDRLVPEAARPIAIQCSSLL